MPIGAIIAIVAAAIIVVVAVATAGIQWLALRQRFGPEFVRLVDELGPRRARAELTARRRHVDGLDIRPLTAQQHASYQRRWAAAQEGFIDDPAAAVNTAAALVAAAEHDRGYPPTVRETELARLSVHHAGPLDGYRQALATQDRADQASTDELRLAMLGTRALFRDLIADIEPAPTRARAPAAEPDAAEPGAAESAGTERAGKEPAGAEPAGAEAGAAATRQE